MFAVVPLAIYQTNYVWLLQVRGETWVVDPGDAAPIIQHLERQGCAPSGVLITHNHWDHVTGLKQLLQRYPMPVFGPAKAKLEQITHPLAEGDALELGGLEVQVWETPGHTEDHLCYYLSQPGALFCGDTLFAAGCGRLLGGTADQLYDSLQRIGRLPEHTEIYCAHEYTLANIDFALAVEPSNLALHARQRQSQALREAQLPTLPSTVELEHATNPFLRVHLPWVQQAASAYCGRSIEGPRAAFAALRHWKNHY